MHAGADFPQTESIGLGRTGQAEARVLRRCLQRRAAVARPQRAQVVGSGVLVGLIICGAEVIQFESVRSHRRTEGRGGGRAER